MLTIFTPLNEPDLVLFGNVRKQEMSYLKFSAFWQIILSDFLVSDRRI